MGNAPMSPFVIPQSDQMGNRRRKISEEKPILCHEATWLSLGELCGRNINTQTYDQKEGGTTKCKNTVRFIT